LDSCFDIVIECNYIKIEELTKIENLIKTAFILLNKMLKKD